MAGWVTWGATVVAALALALLLRVPTHLGVKVEEAARPSPGNLPVELDKRGSEYLWRVWSRASGDLVDIGPSWLMGAALLAGLIVFVLGILAAYRMALSMPSGTPSREV